MDLETNKYENNLELAEELYDEFLEEACELYNAIEKMKNKVRAPFRKLAVLLDIDDEDYYDYHTRRFNDWTNKIWGDVIDLVKSHDLYVRKCHNHWEVFPYDINDPRYNDDTDFNTLCCILTKESGGFTYGEPWDLLDFNEYCENIPAGIDVAKTFEDGLNNIKNFRQSKLKLVEKVCDELRDQLSVDVLRVDCERYVFDTED